MTEIRQRQPRQRDEGYLKWLRKKPCACGCGKSPSDAAHLRAGSVAYGKENPGLGAKPSDCWAMPLHRSCHMRQHAFGDEVLWWSQHGIPDPFGRSMRYYAAYQAECPQTTADAPKQSRTRKPKEAAKSRHESRQRAKIAKRVNPWPKGRKIPSRKK